MKLARLLMAGLGLTVASPVQAGAPLDEVERAAYEICPLIFSGSLRIDDSGALAARGYRPAPQDEEGRWAVLEGPQFVVRIGLGESNPGCRVRYDGVESVRVYEQILRRATERGFVFPDGSRTPAEPQFIMDTLVSSAGPIGILSMFRVLHPDAQAFAMTLFPPIPN